jgi:hypothetical protein
MDKFLLAIIPKKTSGVVDIIIHTQEPVSIIEVTEGDVKEDGKNNKMFGSWGKKPRNLDVFRNSWLKKGGEPNQKKIDEMLSSAGKWYVAYYEKKN